NRKQRSRRSKDEKETGLYPAKDRQQHAGPLGSSRFSRSNRRAELRRDPARRRAQMAGSRRRFRPWAIISSSAAFSIGLAHPESARARAPTLQLSLACVPDALFLFAS